MAGVFEMFANRPLWLVIPFRYSNSIGICDTHFSTLPHTEEKILLAGGKIKVMIKTDNLLNLFKHDWQSLTVVTDTRYYLCGIYWANVVLVKISS